MKEKPGRNRGFSGYFAIIVMCLAVIIALEFSRERTTRADMSYTIGQLTALMNQRAAAGSKIRIMPDCHEGAGCVIGTTMTVQDKVIPNLVGVDIGCGMLVVKLKEKRVDLPKLDSLIHKEVPAGFSIRKTEHKYLDKTRISELLCPMGRAERVTLSLGTLGGGNKIRRCYHGRKQRYRARHKYGQGDDKYVRYERYL